MTKKVDVAIIGASLAGAAAAFSLASSGLSVALFDKSTFPRQKSCGEGLARSGMNALVRLGLGSLLKEPNLTRRFNGFEIFRGLSTRLASMRDRNSTGVTLQRSAFDSALVERTSTLDNVTPFLGTMVERIDVERGEICSTAGLVQSRYIIVADGALSPSSEKLRIPNNARPSSRCGVTYRYKVTCGTLPDSVHIFLFEDGEGYCTPLPGGLINITLLSHSASHTLRRNAERTLLPRVLDALGITAQLVAPAIGASSIGAALRVPRRENVLVIGDACEQLDPIGGMGMTHALGSAALAARAISSAIRDPLRAEIHLQRYVTDRASFVRPLRGFTSLTFRSLVHWRDLPGAGRILESGIARAVSGAAHGDCPSPMYSSFLSCLGALT